MPGAEVGREHTYQWLLRALGAYLDQEPSCRISLTEVPDGFLVRLQRALQVAALQLFQQVGDQLRVPRPQAFEGGAAAPQEGGQVLRLELEGVEGAQLLPELPRSIAHGNASSLRRDAGRKAGPGGSDRPSGAFRSSSRVARSG